MKDYVADLSSQIIAYFEARANILTINDKFLLTVFEVYRIPGYQDLITRQIPLKNPKPIWFRRKDLLGTTLRVAVIQEPPLLAYRETKINLYAIFCVEKKINWPFLFFIV